MAKEARGKIHKATFTRLLSCLHWVDIFQSAHNPSDLVYGHQWYRECLRATRVLIKQVVIMHVLHHKLAVDLRTPVRRIGLSQPHPLSRKSLLGWRSERKGMRKSCNRPSCTYRSCWRDIRISFRKRPFILLQAELLEKHIFGRPG
jgi:hypothetical protein